MKKESATDTWLPARMTPPVWGMYSAPITLQGKNTRSNGPMSTYFIRDQTIDQPYARAAGPAYPSVSWRDGAACDDVPMPGGERLVAAFSSDGGAHRDVGVLLCHGFTGSPASLRPWAEHLAATGYAVRLPLLAGHGTRWQDMNATTFEHWLSGVQAGFDDLSGRCRAVVIGGLSMGGTLALRLAELHPDRVAGLMLVNPSVMTTRFEARFAPLLRRVRPLLLRVMPSLPGIVDDIAKPGVTELGYPRIPIVAALSLQAAWPVVRADLPRVTCPLLLMHSRVDHVVEPANSAIVLTDVSSRNVREVMLENSYHVATLDHDAQLIFSESVDFIERVTAP